MGQVQWNFSKEFFLHSAQEAGALPHLNLHTQSKNLYFFYAITLDHLYAILFQESFFERIIHVHRYHYQFLIFNHFQYNSGQYKTSNTVFIALVAEKSLLSKIARIRNQSKNNYSEILFYFTFLNFGVLKNIILKLKNNIEIVRTGTI